MGEIQTPMHYAAKNNAVASLKTMLRLGAHINDRDYKKRTPLFAAAETGNKFFLVVCFFIWCYTPHPVQSQYIM